MAAAVIESSGHTPLCLCLDNNNDFKIKGLFFVAFKNFMFVWPPPLASVLSSVSSRVDKNGVLFVCPPYLLSCFPFFLLFISQFITKS